MNDTGWDWARLDRNALALLYETESSLGADIVLAYRQGAPLADPATRAGLEPAALSESELECLQGVEQKLGVVAVAYQRA
jgi:hypothetical protein